MPRTITLILSVVEGRTAFLQRILSATLAFAFLGAAAPAHAESIKIVRPSTAPSLREGSAQDEGLR